MQKTSKLTHLCAKCDEHVVSTINSYITENHISCVFESGVKKEYGKWEGEGRLGVYEVIESDVDSEEEEEEEEEEEL